MPLEDFIGWMVLGVCIIFYVVIILPLILHLLKNYENEEETGYGHDADD